MSCLQSPRKDNNLPYYASLHIKQGVSLLFFHYLANLHLFPRLNRRVSIHKYLFCLCHSLRSFLCKFCTASQTLELTPKGSSAGGMVVTMSVSPIGYKQTVLEGRETSGPVNSGLGGQSLMKLLCEDTLFIESDTNTIRLQYSFEVSSFDLTFFHLSGLFKTSF